VLSEIEDALAPARTFVSVHGLITLMPLYVAVISTRAVSADIAETLNAPLPLFVTVQLTALWL
jgi:hypothetical protein